MSWNFLKRFVRFFLCGDCYSSGNFCRNFIPVLKSKQPLITKLKYEQQKSQISQYLPHQAVKFQTFKYLLLERYKKKIKPSFYF